MNKIVFNNPDGKPKPELAKTYTSIISSGISNMKCSTCDQQLEFELVFRAPNTYVIQVTACCPEFKAQVEKKIGLMLS